MDIAVIISLAIASWGALISTTLAIIKLIEHAQE